MPRPHRFLESSASPRPTDLARTFYSDKQLVERMACVRETIVSLRQRWETDRHQLAQTLLLWLERQTESDPAAWQGVLQRWRRILQVDRNWGDMQREPAGGCGEKAAEFSVLREYTEETSYQLVFSRVLQALRASDDTEVLLMVYLIELVNIDLFNYARLGLQRQALLVYRGVSLSQAEWLSYSRLLELPVPSRFIAVPLALTSASRSRQVALEFLLKEADKKQQQPSGSEDPAISDTVACLLVVHVIHVSDSLMERYRCRFPQSVVSTICAVDIAGVSAHPEEQEVLLRGAFFQILRIQQAQEQFLLSSQRMQEPDAAVVQKAVTANVIETLVISANRDHLSNGRLGDQDAPARALFAEIVRVTRYRFCVDFYRERGLVTDEAEYAGALDKAEAELRNLLD